MEVCIQLSAILVDELFDLHNLRKWVKKKQKLNNIQFIVIEERRK